MRDNNSREKKDNNRGKRDDDKKDGDYTKGEKDNDKKEGKTIFFNTSEYTATLNFLENVFF